MPKGSLPNFSHLSGIVRFYPGRSFRRLPKLAVSRPSAFRAREPEGGRFGMVLFMHDGQAQGRQPQLSCPSTNLRMDRRQIDHGMTTDWTWLPAVA